MIARPRRLLLLAVLAPLLARAGEAQPASSAPPAPDATAPATVEPAGQPVPAEQRPAGPVPAEPPRAGPGEPPPPGPTEEEDDDPSLYEGWATPQEPEPPRPEPITLLFSLGAYYTSAGLYLPLTRTPTPDAGEQSEAQLYWRLLQRALVPRFVVLEASVNPMPCAGLLARRWDEGYRRAQLTGELNAVRALTAGFDEPFAVSLFVGNVADYDVRGRRDVRGRGYLGVVVSGGAGHIKDNALYQDRWLEAEVKLKGDRTTDAARLSWSFRAGVKLHDNPWIADTAYLGLRRSRVDFEEGDALLANAGAEYRFDASLAGKPLRHFLLVDRKWPLGRWKAALVLGVGVLWEAGAAYRGPLAGREGEAVQLLVRPNLVF